MRIGKLVLGIFVLALIAQSAQAKLVLDGITYDPAVVAAGDEVDIIIQFHDEINREPIYDYMQDPEYQLRVKLQPDDTVSEDHVTILDEEGDKLVGHVYPGQYYNVRYRIKVQNDAPVGNYQFKLKGTYEYEGESEKYSSFIRFEIPVKKEGIILGVSNIITSPAEVRPGDDYVRVDAYLENVGEKPAKAVSIDLDMPEGITSSYSNDNHVWVGRLNNGESKQVSFYLDLDKNLEPGTYDIGYDMEYMDLDNNQYIKTMQSRLLVKDRPYLVVDSYEGSGEAGSSGELKINVKNEGGTSAESVDVRLIKQSSQPFNFDVRSKYLGELEPGETATAIFDIDVRREADYKNHSFKVVMRAKGDTDEGDDRIYMFDREAEFEVTGKAPNYVKNLGIGAIAIVLLGIVYNVSRKKK